MEIIVKIVFEKALPFKHYTYKNKLGMFYGTQIRALETLLFILTIVIVAIDVTTNQL